MEEEVQGQPSALPLGFLCVDARPLKQALVAWISKWIFLYTQCLQEQVCFKAQMYFIMRLCRLLTHIVENAQQGVLWEVQHRECVVG
jgi:hypothetical protein